jgi:hypothetical protein
MKFSRDDGLATSHRTLAFIAFFTLGQKTGCDRAFG